MKGSFLMAFLSVKSFREIGDDLRSVIVNKKDKHVYKTVSSLSKVEFRSKRKFRKPTFDNKDVVL